MTSCTVANPHLGASLSVPSTTMTRSVSGYVSIVSHRCPILRVSVTPPQMFAETSGLTHTTLPTGPDSCWLDVSKPCRLCKLLRDWGHALFELEVHFWAWTAVACSESPTISLIYRAYMVSLSEVSAESTRTSMIA